MYKVTVPGLTRETYSVNLFFGETLTCLALSHLATGGTFGLFISLRNQVYLSLTISKVSYGLVQMSFTL